MRIGLHRWMKRMRKKFDRQNPDAGMFSIDRMANGLWSYGKLLPAARCRWLMLFILDICVSDGVKFCGSRSWQSRKARAPRRRLQWTAADCSGILDLDITTRYLFVQWGRLHLPTCKVIGPSPSSPSVHHFQDPSTQRNTGP
jgi:hypothetical protein